jgi:peptidoglycan/LPS O-acetylase OafA/YrhL
MVGRLGVAMRRPRRSAVAFCAVLALGTAVTLAHSSVGNDHMGEAVAMCSVALFIGAVAAAWPASPVRRPARPPRAVAAPLGTRLAPHVHRPRPCTRGDPALLQVFRT